MSLPYFEPADRWQHFRIRIYTMNADDIRLLLVALVSITVTACQNDKDASDPQSLSASPAPVVDSVQLAQPRHFGAIRFVEHTPSGFVAGVDFMVLLDDDDNLADGAAIEAGEIRLGDNAPNDYYIVNTVERMILCRYMKWQGCS